MTVLWGANGQGKTNIIEALYFLAAQRSFRTSDTAHLVRSGAARARLGADIDTGGLMRRVEIDLSRAGGPPERVERTVKIDGKVVRGAAAIFGALSAVVFVPEHLLLPRAAPAARRRFLDLVIFAVERAFHPEALAYQRVLRNRNALLRRPPIDPTLLDTYDDECARTGARVVVRRRAAVAALGPEAAGTFRAIHGDLPLGLEYRSHAAIARAPDELAVRAALAEGLGTRRELDLRRGQTTFGPHTDDLAIVLCGRLAREHASQGQLRSIVLSLKLAELALIGRRVGEPPVLLLDDVASELDPERRRDLFDRVGGLPCQTVISAVDLALVPRLPDREDFHVVAGSFHFTGPPISAM